MLPDYMPAADPLVVHFPIVLLILGVVLDMVAAVLPRPGGRADLFPRSSAGRARP